MNKLAENIGFLFGLCIRFAFIALVGGCTAVLVFLLLIKFGLFFGRLLG